ncbi:MAG: YdcF family protein [Holosporaceae bacterium]|jgi:uncharacterized SAM-binding protein YcdF (DUF218 family)|nr:YdcF family protein [Holosporaceae bacterium]
MKFVRKFLSVAIACWVGAVFVFILYIILYEHKYESSIENIVVLTGGPNRIARAIQLLKSHEPKNIFISGVYEKTILRDILPEGSKEGVNFFLGKQARNTRENALEINEWVIHNNILEILLITSDYHIPRSIMELKAINSSLQIHSCGVKSRFCLGFVWRCIKELHKIMYVYIRNFF